MIATASTEPTFLYSQSRQFPFDEVCEQIVRALEDRNWSVPGLDVEFDVYGSGAQKYRLVRNIKGDGFKLRFGRPQRLLGDWNDTAAVTEIIIPQKELHVYDDESGPTYYVYVGKDWNSDKEQFLSGSKINSKLRGEPRTYLLYKGGCDCRATFGASFPAVEYLTAILTDGSRGLADLKHTHRGRRSPILVHDNDLGREYEPKKGEPESYRTNDVFMEFVQWLEDTLLAMILAQPAADEKIDFFRETATPFPEGAGPIFCFGDWQDAYRVHQGKLDINQLKPSDRYGFTGGGYRLLNLMVGNDGTVPEVAYDGFKWCGFGEVTAETSPRALDVPGHYRWTDRERFIFRIVPTSADGIYVADNGAYEQRREALFEEIKPRDRLTDAELAEAERARARTIVPINEYDGSYMQPVVLINRELGFDEVELVGGEGLSYLKHITQHNAEAAAAIEKVIELAKLHDYSEAGRSARDEAIDSFRTITKDDLTLFSWVESFGGEANGSFRSNHDRDAAILTDRAIEFRDYGLF